MPQKNYASPRFDERGKSIRLALIALLFYSCIFLIKASMFACSWKSMPNVFGLQYKTCLALAQTFGYAAGKMPAIIYSPKLPASRLRGALITVVCASGTCVCLSCAAPAKLALALVAFACVWLAPTWSLLQRYLEGRRDTEAIVAIVSFSYIGASGLCKGLCVDLVLLFGLSEREAVAACAAIGIGVGVAAAFGVAAQPPPSAADIEKRGRRKAMVSYRTELDRLLRGGFGVGIGLAVVAYTMLGALRAYRDYYQLELFQAVGLAQSSSLFALSEFTVSLFVLGATAGFSAFEDNRSAMHVILRVAAPGALSLALLTYLNQSGLLGGLPWMIGIGACTFLCCARSRGRRKPALPVPALAHGLLTSYRGTADMTPLPFASCRRATRYDAL